MAKRLKVAAVAAVGMVLPFMSRAQTVADEMRGMHAVLEKLFDEMLPLCSQLISIGQGIAGFAAIWYIASRVWKHIANAEPIDFYPLFRPFVIGFCILVFPSVIAMINGVMKPTVTATSGLVKDSDKAIATLLKKKEEAIKESTPWKMYVGESGSGNRDEWYKYTHDGADPSNEGLMESIGNDVKFAAEKMHYRFRNSVKEWMSEILRILYEAAALCINTIRTFQLLVLAILGPLVFGMAVFDGFQHTLTSWIARYLNVFLWLPVANIFGAIIGKVQENMIKLDLAQINQQGDAFFSSTDAAYLAFLIIGIVGYFTVPSVANYIIHAGGASAMTQKVTSMISSTASRANRGMDNIAGMGNNYREGLEGKASGAGVAGAMGRAIGHGGGYMADKLSGKS